MSRENKTLVEQTQAPSEVSRTLRKVIGARAASIFFEARAAELRKAGFFLEPSRAPVSCTPARIFGGATRALAEAIASDCPPVATLLETHARCLVDNSLVNRVAAAEARGPWVDVREYDDDGEQIEYYSRHLYTGGWPETNTKAVRQSFFDVFDDEVTAIVHDGAIYVWCQDDDAVGLADSAVPACEPWLSLLKKASVEQEELNTTAAHDLRGTILGIETPSSVSVRLKVHGNLEPFEAVLDDTQARHLVTHLTLRSDNPTRRPASPLGARFPSMQALVADSVVLPLLLEGASFSLESLVVETWPGLNGMPMVFAALDLPALSSLRHLGLWKAHLEPSELEALARHVRTAQLCSLDLSRAENSAVWGHHLLRLRPHLAHLRWLWVPEEVTEKFPQAELDAWPALVPCRHGHPESVALDIETYGWPPYEW